MDVLLAINKPKNMTSHDVTQIIKRSLRVKIGHMGTLDPQAKGLLILLTGSKTKYLPYLQASPKVYEAKLQLGLKTDTGDRWGKLLNEAVVGDLTDEEINRVLQSFVGPQVQRVPMVSAKKLYGKKLYEYHRQNIEVPQQFHEIDIEAINFLGYDQQLKEISFTATVSTGTYIRTLCEDIGERLNLPATMSALTRLAIGPYHLHEAGSLEAVLANPELFILDEIRALNHLPMVEVRDIKPVYHGKPLALEREEEQVLITHQNQVVAVYKRQPNGLYHSERGLW